MNYQAILTEAREIGVTINDRQAEVWFRGQHEASMYHDHGRSWRGLSRSARQETVRTTGTKASVADWCLEQAANGPV
jgi:hypothetical protein